MGFVNLHQDWGMPSWKSKDGFFFNTSGAPLSTWEPRPLASSSIKRLACTKRRSLPGTRTRYVSGPYSATIVPAIHFSFPPRVFFTLTGWYKSKIRPLGWSPSLYILDATSLSSTCLCKLGLIKQRCFLGSLFKTAEQGSCQLWMWCVSLAK